MTRRTDITRAVIAILAVCLFMAMVSGCVPEDEHIKEVELRKSVQRLLRESISTNGSLLCQRATLQDELLKANAEIVACWELIEDMKPDPNTPPVWGKGELPPEWVEYFGDSNLSRMSFKQSQVIDALTSKVFEVSGPVDPNGVK